MRYPIGIQDFATIVEGDYVYVDKTDLVYNLAKEHICFLSRPRRFGKSLLINTLDSYFSGKQELFCNLKINHLEKEWNQFPVFRVDFSVGDYSKPNELNIVLDNFLKKWEQKYNLYDIPDSLGVRFLNILEASNEQTGHKAVVLIDEYDKPMLDVLGTNLEEINRNILKGFLGAFKAADAHLRFVLLTGVTKFSQVSVFSGFNQPKDISMDSRYAAICGITEEELQLYFAEPINVMAKKYNITDCEMMELLKKQYDGYHFSEEMLDIYNPFSLINAFDLNRIDDYWYRSGTPTYLAKLLEGHNINMQKLLGRSYSAEYFIDYRADSEEPLAMLYQSGYLTIKAYDNYYREYTLDYPNNEVKQAFITLTANNYLGTLVDRPDVLH